jgi:ribosomal protein L20
MVRVKRGNVARKRRKKVLKIAKGYVGSHSKLFRAANQQVMKALKYAYRQPSGAQTRVPPPLDYPHQRGCSHRRACL